MRLSFALAALFFALPAPAEVTIDWVAVANPGNACDTQAQGCFGAVAYDFRIGKYEVTNAQYREFLSAVAATDTHALYNTEMGDIVYPGLGGIARSGSPGSYSYSTIAGREDKPVNFVSFHDALRFANWLHNGQPTGAQDGTTTEDGAYTITALGITNNSITRNAGARIFLTSEDEWYKAAYYNGAGYFDYPVGSDTQTTCAAPGAVANTANCGNAAASDLTDVGSYTASASPNGSYDQGGNVWEWNEAIISVSYRGHLGGAFYNAPNTLAASLRGVDDPADESNVVGFRVASRQYPEGIPAVTPLGLFLVTAGLLGYGVYRRGRA